METPAKRQKVNNSQSDSPDVREPTPNRVLRPLPGRARPDVASNPPSLNELASHEEIQPLDFSAPDRDASPAPTVLDFEAEIQQTSLSFAASLNLGEAGPGPSTLTNRLLHQREQDELDMQRYLDPFDDDYQI